MHFLDDGVECSLVGCVVSDDVGLSEPDLLKWLVLSLSNFGDEVQLPSRQVSDLIPVLDVHPPHDQRA